jgi:thiol-disulfide isomerase/thioredoxin
MKNAFLFVALALIFGACSHSVKESDTNLSEAEIFENTKVAVFYFHGKMRCPTCNELEKVSREAVEENFADNDDVNFYEIDFSIKENQDISNKYEVAFSSLVIAKKDNHIDISMETFPLVFSDPNQIKELIINEVNNYLNN